METDIDEPPSQIFSLILAVFNEPFGIVSIIALLVLLVCSAFVSGSEVAFFSLTSKNIEECKQSEKKSDQRVLALVKNPRKLLATILILNNFVNVAIVTLSTVLMWRLLEGSPNSTAITIATPVLVTFAIVFFGEVIPKIYAIQNNLALARSGSLLMKAFQRVLSPLSYLLTSMSSIIERRVEKKGYDISIEELNKALELTATEQETTEEERDILKGIVNFGTLTVTQVMKSRIDIIAIDNEMKYYELLDIINKSGYSRIPVFDETVDKIEGILYIKDLLPFIDHDDDFKWQELIRPGFFVPESKKIDTLLKDFQEKRIHLAIVVDEYGGTSGLITLEDVIEEIIGEINDEFDDEDIAYNKHDDNTYVFEGKTLLNDFCKIIEVEPTIFEAVKGESETLGGLILELSNKLPSAGEKVEFESFIFTVVAVDKKRIKRVRVFYNSQNE